MRTWINISKSALLNNFDFFTSIRAFNSVIPIIKSNAYGHGLEEVFSILKERNPPWLGVNYVEEAETLRNLKYGGRILVVGPCSFEDISMAGRIAADVFIGDMPSLNHWMSLQQKPRIHLKFDTGMSRQGFGIDLAEKVINEIGPETPLIEGVCSHFANVEDVLDTDYAQTQLNAFKKVIQQLEASGIKVKKHIASSASTLIFPESLLDFSRVGISLYGLWPSQATKLSYMRDHKTPAPLQPALSWQTEVALVKPIAAGQFVGYGCTYRAAKPMDIAVLPVGYYEGYPRSCGDKASYVLIRGSRCQVVGRICMNMMMVDVTHLKNCMIGDRVTLIGTDGKDSIPAETAGDWAGTIHYELLTRLSPNIERKIVD